MSWKLVRDKNQAWARAHGVSGQWRTSSDPVSALTRKLFEEAGEYVEAREPAELYDLLDVLETLIDLEDPDGRYADEHAAKFADMGGFAEFSEWNPVPSLSERNDR